MTTHRRVLWKGHAMPVYVTRDHCRGFVLIGHGHLSDGAKEKYDVLAGDLALAGCAVARFSPASVHSNGRKEARSLSTDAEQLQVVYDSLAEEFGPGVVLGYSTSAAAMHGVVADAYVGLLPVNLADEGRRRRDLVSRSEGVYVYDGNEYVYTESFWNNWDEWADKLPERIGIVTKPVLYIASETDPHARAEDVKANYFLNANEEARLASVKIPHHFRPGDSETIAEIVGDWIEEQGIFGKGKKTSVTSSRFS